MPRLDIQVPDEGINLQVPASASQLPTLQDQVAGLKSQLDALDRSFAQQSTKTDSNVQGLRLAGKKATESQGALSKRLDELQAQVDLLSRVSQGQTQAITDNAQAVQELRQIIASPIRLNVFDNGTGSKSSTEMLLGQGELNIRGRLEVPANAN